ncbi:MAG TPA: hypothetical protein VHF26_23830, partial [Trebonia sp.]|nr:hypothetical protein [Trebonia sp.]
QPDVEHHRLRGRRPGVRQRQHLAEQDPGDRQRADRVLPHLDKFTSGVADHPLFRDSARTYAHLFDMQHDPAHAGDLTCPSPGAQLAGYDREPARARVRALLAEAGQDPAAAG